LIAKKDLENDYEFTVIGKLKKNKIVPLEDKEISFCKEKGFTYEKKDKEEN
jgi:hypothetical protein